jgi:hypothetical protein
MKRSVLALTAVVALFSLLASTAFAAPDRVVTIEKGKLKILHVGFALAAGSNSNPAVLHARPDPNRNRLFLVARDVGDATYVIDGTDEKGARRLEVQVRVVEASPE